MERILLNAAEEGKKCEKNKCSLKMKPGGQQQKLIIIRTSLFHSCKKQRQRKKSKL